MSGKRMWVPTLKSVSFIPDVSAISVKKQARSEYSRLDDVLHGIAHNNEDVASDLKVPEIPDELIKQSKRRIHIKKSIVRILVAMPAIMFITAVLFALYGAAANDNSQLRFTVIGLLLPAFALRWTHNFSQQRVELTYKEMSSSYPELMPFIGAATILRDNSTKLFAVDGHGRFFAYPDTIWGVDNWLLYILGGRTHAKLLFAKGWMPSGDLYISKQDAESFLESRHAASGDTNGVPLTVDKDCENEGPQHASSIKEKKAYSNAIELETILTDIVMAKTFEFIILQLGARKKLPPISP